MSGDVTVCHNIVQHLADRYICHVHELASLRLSPRWTYAGDKGGEYTGEGDICTFYLCCILWQREVYEKTITMAIFHKRTFRNKVTRYELSVSILYFEEINISIR